MYRDIILHSNNQFLSKIFTQRDLLLAVGMSVVVAVALALLVEALGAAVEFVSMEIRASMTVELLGPAPNIKREPGRSKTNIC